MINLTKVRDDQVADKTSSLSVSVRVFPDENKFELIDWIKKSTLPNAGGHNPIWWGPE